MLFYMQLLFYEVFITFVQSLVPFWHLITSYKFCIYSAHVFGNQHPLLPLIIPSPLSGVEAKKHCLLAYLFPVRSSQLCMWGDTKSSAHSLLTYRGRWMDSTPRGWDSPGSPANHIPQDQGVLWQSLQFPGRQQQCPMKCVCDPCKVMEDCYSEGIRVHIKFLNEALAWPNKGAYLQYKTTRNKHNYAKPEWG